MNTDAIELTKDEQTKKAELEERHGPVYLIKACGLAGWFKEPSVLEIDCYMDEQMAEKTRGRALLSLMRSKLVFPEVDGKSFFAKRPGAMLPFSQAYAEAVGITADATLGK